MKGWGRIERELICSATKFLRILWKGEKGIFFLSSHNIFGDRRDRVWLSFPSHCIPPHFVPSFSLGAVNQVLFLLLRFNGAIKTAFSGDLQMPFEIILF